MLYTEITDSTISSFRSFFLSENFVEENSLKITSGFDNSTVFIGSTTSVFKHYIKEGNNSLKNRFIVQPCIRTQNSHFLYNDNILPKWGSYFVGLGLFSNPDKIKDLSVVIKNFIINELCIEPARLLFRVSSKDTDFLTLLEETESKENIEIDFFSIEYYRHQYGMEDIYGRNFNYAIKLNDESLRDFGNLVVIEKKGIPICLEFGLGISTFLSAKYNKQHPLQCSTIADILEIKDLYYIKLADSILVSVILLKEGLKPSASSMGKILRKYLQAISYLSNKCNFTISDIEKIIFLYEQLEYNDTSDLSKKISSYLYLYKNLTENNHKDINRKLSTIFS